MPREPRDGTCNPLADLSEEAQLPWCSSDSIDEVRAVGDEAGLDVAGVLAAAVLDAAAEHLAGGSSAPLCVRCTRVGTVTRLHVSGARLRAHCWKTGHTMRRRPRISSVASLGS